MEASAIARAITVLNEMTDVDSRNCRFMMTLGCITGLKMPDKVYEQATEGEMEWSEDERIGPKCRESPPPKEKEN